MTNCNWTNDLTVSGTVAWNQISGAVDANVTFTAAGHSGTETIIWNDQQTEAIATLGGTIDGAALAATRLAP
jgi:putative NIF3 family GTP cyclohydrolase 1 type 2